MIYTCHCHMIAVTDLRLLRKFVLELQILVSQSESRIAAQRLSKEIFYFITDFDV